MKITDNNYIKCLLSVFLAVFLAFGLVFLPKMTVNAEEKDSGFTLTENSRFYILSEEEPQKQLSQTVRTVASQFAAESIPGDQPLSVVCGGKENHQSGDIIISLVDGKTEDQSYDIKTDGKGSIVVTSAGTDGIFYGLDALLQTFLSEGTTVSDLDISEQPDAKERTLLLDCGRKYYSPDWIKNLIQRMSWQRYTSLELHFSETDGMRLESKKFPWLNEPEGEYLTYEDLESICQTAKKYHVEIIPDFDSPGHMDYVIERYAAYVAEHPDYTFEYDGTTYSSDDEGFSNISNYYMYNGAKSEYNNTGIDISNPVAVAFTNSLIDEYADFFKKYGSRKFNIGGDELFGWTGTTVGGRSFGYYDLWSALEHWQTYAREELGIKNGSASDAFITYLNSLGNRLQGKGYECRVWNDEMHRTDDQTVELDPSIGIVYWSNDYTPMKELAANGNTIYNTNTGWCYYVIREDKKGGDIMDRTRKHCNAYYIFENWNIRNCANPKKEETLIPEKSYGGSYFAIWADEPDYKDENQVFADTLYRTWANSSKMWDNDIDEEMSYNDFKSYVDQIGVFPGYSGDPELSEPLPECGDVEKIKSSVFQKIAAFFQKLF